MKIVKGMSLIFGMYVATVAVLAATLVGIGL